MSWTFTLLLLHLKVCIFNEASGLLLGASKEKLNQLFTEYDITHPTVVTQGGSFISHDVSNAASVTGKYHAQRDKRRRRSLDDTIEVSFIGESDLHPFNHSIDVRNDMDRDFDNHDALVSNFTSGLPFPTDSHAIWTNHIRRQYLHFNMSAFGRNLQLRLENKQTLIAPGAKSIFFTRDGRKIEKDLSTSCLYFGKIPQHPSSKVAISNCNGLAGYIQTNDGEYYIEPLEDLQSDEKPQRHVVYKRSSLSENAGKRMDKVKKENIVEDHIPLSETIDVLPQTDNKDSRRRKRHVKRADYNIEVLLTADYSVVRFHGRNNVENYLLTLMNIVDEIYHDSTLGEHVNIVLSRLYLLDESRSRNLVRLDSRKVSLKNVCRWANKTYQSDPPSNGKFPDYSIFLTRISFGPAGYAHVQGMCDRKRSCSLNYEDGFSSAFVIAHETGHVLGMEHDGEGNKCGDETSMGSIMAPIVQSAFHRYHWSRCSQQELRKNLRAFTCLLDDPHTPDWGPVPVYPGVTYSLDDQCRFDFGQGYKRCTAFRNMDVCRTLWCSHGDNPLLCKTKKGPPIDGTECGENMWCFKSHCIWRSQRERLIHGNWGTWSSYSDCSRTCGTGVMYRSRRCDNPAPAQGGSDCVGQSIGYDLCSKRSCPKGRDFRADQCMYHNNQVEFKNQRHKWLPYEPLAADLKCDLYCVSKKTNDVVTMGDFVADGTPCTYDDPHSVCIRGECVEIGCDRRVGSRLREDVCGVCDGDGSRCRNISSKITRRVKRKVNTYMKLYKIPQGSRHIRIQEEPSSANGNLLALKSRSDRQYILNGKAKQILEHEAPYRAIGAGTLWNYESTRHIETITARGPTNTVVMLMILVKQRNVRIGVTYSYIRPSKVASKARDAFRYEIRRWSSCSVTCGSGIRRGRYGCRNVKKRKWVSRKKCRGKTSRTGRRGSRTQECTVECRTSARWASAEWSSCSTSCGSDGWQQREVNCQKTDSRGNTETVNERLCMAEEKPSARRICHTEECPPEWRSDPWSPCSVTCGNGTQQRHVWCVANNRTASTSECSNEKPNSKQACKVEECSSSRNSSSVTTSRSSALPSHVTANETGPCNEEPVYCQAMSLYCGKLQWRHICCQSCQNWSSPLPEDTQSNPTQEPNRFSIFSSANTGRNNTVRATDITFENRARSSEIETTNGRETFSPTSSTRNPSRRGKRRRKINKSNNQPESRKKRSFFYSFHGKSVKENKLKLFFRPCCMLLKSYNFNNERNVKRCREVCHRKVFPRSRHTSEPSSRQKKQNQLQL